jgi:hypothetical protein
MSVVMPREWDSEEGYLQHIHPTKVSRTKPSRITPQCHDITRAETYTFTQEENRRETTLR